MQEKYFIIHALYDVYYNSSLQYSVLEKFSCGEVFLIVLLYLFITNWKDCVFVRHIDFENEAYICIAAKLILFVVQ